MKDENKQKTPTNQIIGKHPSERANFIKKDTISMEWVINWEFAIFEATDEQWEALMSNFIQKPKMNEAQKSLIVDKHGK